ncbi:MAG TPA: hypothetical protein DCR04_06675 [Flavobacteriales bacterium]|nr:hypothetical protein [Flavobacteriales bacterium]
MISVSDGIIIIGTTVNGGNTNAFLLKTDFSGNAIWQKYFESGSEGFGLKCTNDNSLILIGSLTDQADDRDFLLTKTDLEGNIIWQKEFGGVYSDQAKDVIALENGGFMMIGITSSFGAGAASMYVVRTDGNGNEVWSRTFSGGGIDGGSELLQVNSFEVMLLGFTSSFGAGDRDIYLQKVSVDGDSLWSSTYGGSGYEESQAFAQTADGGFVMSNHTASEEPNHSLMTSRLDAGGTTIWQQEFGTPTAHEGGEGILVDSEGNFVFLGRTNSYGNDEQVYYIKTDADGNVLEQLNFGGEGDQTGTDIVEIDDAHFITGRSTVAGDTDILLMKRPR